MISTQITIQNRKMQVVNTLEPGVFMLVVQFIQWEFQDPKMEVLYHIRPSFVVIFPYRGLV